MSRDERKKHTKMNKNKRGIGKSNERNVRKECKMTKFTHF